MTEVRPFARHDRDGLTSLANRHIAAVLPGGAVPVAALLSQMERDSAEYVVDPWVVERHTLVGVAADRVLAAAHLKRYGTDSRVGEGLRDAGVIDWLICDPTEPELGFRVLQAAMDQLALWRARTWHADGALPCLGVYGIPDSWPHIRALLENAGFSDDRGQIEVIFAGDVGGVAQPGPPPVAGLELRRLVGPLGTSFDAVLDGRRVGVFEVEDTYGTTNSQLARWADEGNHWVEPELRDHGIGSWLFRHGCAWLRLGRKDRILTYAIERRGACADPMESNAARCETYYARHGLIPITRTRRGWEREPWSVRR